MTLIALALPGILLSFTVHEWAHGWTAYALGDPTPRHQGRLDLNPFKHLDPLGAFLCVLIGYGWGKPVLFDPRNLRKPERDIVLVAVAGPLANFALGVLLCLAMAALPREPLVFAALNLGALISFGMFLFNILPFPPLDGSQLLFLAIPTRHDAARLKLLRWGSIALLIIIAADNILGLGILPIGSFANMLLGFFFRLFGGTPPESTTN